MATTSSSPSSALADGRIWLYTYAVVAVLNLVAVVFHWTWANYLTKPLLLLLLTVYVAGQTTAHPGQSRRIALAALLASAAGDTLLMWSGQSAVFFLLGLGAFLLTQLGYAWLFARSPGFREGGVLFRYPLAALPLVFYWLMLVLLLWPGLAGALRPAVGIYSLVITLMALSCFNLRSLLPRSTYQPLMVGVLLFLLSDSLIGLSRFRPDLGPIPQPGFLIMGTYLLAQYLIARQLPKLVRLQSGKPL